MINEEKLRRFAESMANVASMERVQFVNYAKKKLRLLLTELQSVHSIPPNYYDVSDLMTQHQLCGYFKIKGEAVYNWVERGHIKYVVVGSTRYYQASEVEKYMIDNDYLTEPSSEYITLDDAALKYEGIPKHIISKAIRGGALKTKRYGNFKMIHIPSLQKYIEENNFKYNWNQRRVI